MSSENWNCLQQVAWELEQWRRSEQVRLQAQWKQQEAARMKMLEDKWKVEEMKRRETTLQKQKEMGKLERKLKDALFDLEKQVHLNQRSQYIFVIP